MTSPEYERSQRPLIRVNCAAINRDLRAEISAGRFREDLYFRLNVFPIDSIPLKERPEDIPPLAQLFLKHACRKFHRQGLELSNANVGSLQQYSWPGNVRELKNPKPWHRG